MYDGRIGNNIFQISSVMGMAIANKLECGFEKWRYAHHFKNQLPELKRQTYYKVYEKNFHYNQYDIPDYNYELCGFFQSWKYFAHCEDVIRKQFEFSDAVKSKVKEKYGKNREEDEHLRAQVIRTARIRIKPIAKHWQVCSK